MTDYYVASNGSNGNSGLSPAAPWLTLAHAQANTVASDRIFHRSGDVWSLQTYSFSSTRTLGVYNGSSRWVMDYATGDGGDFFPMLNLQGNSTVVDSLEFRNNLSGGTVISGARGIQFTGDNFTLTNSYGHEIGTTGVIRDFSGDNPIIDGLIIEHTDEFNTAYTGSGGYPGGGWGAGLSFSGEGDPINGGVVKNSQFFEMGGEGFTMGSQGGNVVVEDNDVAGGWSTGLYDDGCSNVIYRRNIIVGTTNATYHRYPLGAPAFCGPAIAQAAEPWHTNFTETNNVHRYHNLSAYCMEGMWFSDGTGVGWSSDIRNMHVAHNSMVSNRYNWAVVAGSGVADTNIIEQNASICIGTSNHDNGSDVFPGSGITWRENYYEGGGEHANHNSGSDFSDFAWLPEKTTGWQSLTPSISGGVVNLTVSDDDFRPDTLVVGSQFTNPDTSANWTDKQLVANFIEAGALTATEAEPPSTFVPHAQVMLRLNKF